MRIPPATTRGRAAARWAAGVLVLALVILVLSALASPKDSARQSSTTSLTSRQQSALKFQQAQQAEASGETTEAVRLLEQAVVLDSANQQARRLLVRLRYPAGAGGSTSRGNADTTETPDESTDAGPDASDSAFLQPVADLTALLPVKATGYSLGSPIAEGSDAVVSGSASTPYARVTRIVWTVHDRDDHAAALRFVEEVAKRLYPVDARMLRIDGAIGYAGTDGTRFASVVFVRGRYAFEVVVTPAGLAPKTVMKDAIEAARAFPSAPQ